MATAENAKLQYEAGQTAYPMAALTDNGGHKVFESSAAVFSKKVGHAPIVRPNGLITGGIVTPAGTIANNTIDVSAISCYLAGIKTAVGAATSQTITRAATNVSKISSITVSSAGAIAIVAGTDGTDATFSETRAAAGGPPLIPVGSIEVAQVRYSSNVAAAVVSTEIFQVPGLHMEYYNYPGFSINYEDANVEFTSALPLSHTGAVPKKIYASYADPIFADVSEVKDFKPAETTHRVSSTQIYRGTIGNSSSSLGQGGFTAYLENGIGDPLVSLKNQILWFKFFPDYTQTPYIMTNGRLGIGRTFPAGDGIQAACTISADHESFEVNA